jgi:hypothetical protein
MSRAYSALTMAKGTTQENFQPIRKVSAHAIIQAAAEARQIASDRRKTKPATER